MTMTRRVTGGAQTPGHGRKRRWPLVVGCALALGALTGCGDSTRQLLGLDKNVPDEFKIINRAPLSLPPDFALRPPDPGATRPQEATIGQRAVAAVTGVTPSNTDSSDSPGEAALMKHFGSERADPNIREVVNKESSVLANADQDFLDKLMFWRKQEDTSPVVDAPREAQRLRENAALGKSPEDGDTPTIRRRKKALLEDIF